MVLVWGASSLALLASLHWSRRSLPLAFVEQLERMLHCVPVKCASWKTCIFVTECVFLFRADTALYLFSPGYWCFGI